VPNPPIIIKKISGHAGHHGGAWKVAYADFVTALMALFIVLWLLNTSKQVQEAVGGYFKDPSGTAKLVGSTNKGAGESIDLTKERMKEIKAALEKQVRSLPDFEKLKSHIEMTITAEGLRIELTEGENGTFFESGNALPSPSGKELLVALAEELGKLPNRISIEGHTDNKPYSGGLQSYSNWELSVDRGNATRRIMQSSGLRADQVAQVRGFADQQPRPNAKPDDPANRRITLIVLYVAKDATQVAPPADPSAPANAEKNVGQNAEKNIEKK
jgi:chemotaxis protein MotB